MDLTYNVCFIITETSGFSNDYHCPNLLEGASATYGEHH